VDQQTARESVDRRLGFQQAQKRNRHMTQHVLITGGAGFIGSHLADELLQSGYRVRALDSLAPQVHGADAGRPDYLDPEVELVVADVCDSGAVRRALEGIDAVFHLAAVVGVGQSMYDVRRYTDVNNVGTAVLLEALIEKPVSRLVVASSMSLYGEGLYQRPDGEVRVVGERSMAYRSCRCRHRKAKHPRSHRYTHCRSSIRSA
jgi:dTDP-L-rhamnose 4-epimerase